MWQIIGFVLAVIVGIWVGALILMDSRSRTAALESELKELKDRVEKLEHGSEIMSFVDTEKVYVETASYFGMPWGRTIDQPRKIKLVDAVRVIIDHFGLQLRYQDGEPATPGSWALQKPPKKGAK